MKRIFVQMVSYRDPECHHTLVDMFAKAKHPERLSVGLCWQYDPAEDAEMLSVPLPRAEQVRVVQYHADEALGAGWARGEVQKLWAGEEYVLQLQAHHRFEPNWDETLIDLLEGLPTPKAVLTAWLPGYTPPDTKADLHGMLPVATINRLGDANDAQVIHLIKRMVPQEEVKAPFVTASWVGNFMFARAEVLKDVPFDPHIFFWGEELNYSARLWTHGYDIYHMDRVVLYHYWDRKQVKGGKAYRDHASRRNRESLARNLHVLGLEPADDPSVLQDIQKYALGSERSIADYFAFIGVDLARGTVAPHARLGDFSPQKHAADGRPKIFVAIASFRDPETQYTVADLFARATYPDRVFVGVCHQLHMSEDEDCVFTPERPGQVQIQQVDYRESKGANWARAQALTLHKGEEYTLLIDAHMRFAQGWDETLIDTLARCPVKDAAVSGYSPGYRLPDKIDYSPYYVLRTCVNTLGSFDDPQLLHLTGKFVKNDSPHARIYPSPFIVANFIFARAELWKRVPIDPHIFFWGDEISLSARLWTHGIDVYQPDSTITYHLWERQDQYSKLPYRKQSNEESQRSRKRVRHLLGIEATRDKKALAGLERYGLGNVRPLADFWAFAGINITAGTVQNASKQGIWNDINATKVIASRPRIFVQIASYRDPDCQHTVKDMFDKAAYPERIFAGICWQFVADEDANCFQVPYPFPEHVRVHEVDARQGKGVCWARALTQALWQGEEFTLQIDSHMRFEPGWDETLFSMWRACHNDRAVLSCYPPSFTPPDQLNRRQFYGMAAKEFDEDGILRMHGVPAYVPENPPLLPIPGAFAGACMVFGPASIISDVPYDPHLYFFGEEITLAVRLWTHGYDLYHPNGLVLYHDWDRGKRPTHFSDHAQSWVGQHRLAVARIQHMLGMQHSEDAQVLVDMEKYGLGTERSLAEYERYSGVGFRQRSISSKALKGEFAMKGQAKIFVRIASYRDSECQHTVRDLFEKAAHPERVFVGICWQFDEAEDAHCFEVTTRPDQVRVIPVDWRESEGVCWARAQTEMLMEDEEYTLQIDSHMRFTPGWDEALIQELALCPSPKAVLSCSPAQYTPPDNLQQNPRPTVRRVLPFTANGNIRGRGESLERAPEAPLNGAFIAAGFIFSRSELLREVPYDPYLYFDQEEIMYALRLYTHGWDVFSARQQYLYHYYNDAKQSVRPLHWGDMKSAHEEKLRFYHQRGLARFNHLTRHKRSEDPAVLVDMDKYGLGSVRSLEEFEAYSGVDFKRKIAHPKALQCGFIPNLSRYRTVPMAVDEVKQYYEKKPEFVFGAGDRLPYFVALDSDGKKRAIELMAGTPLLLFFLSFAEPQKHKAFLMELSAALKKQQPRKLNVLLVVDITPEALSDYKQRERFPLSFWADPQGSIRRALGFKEHTIGLLLNANLQITQMYERLPVAEFAAQSVSGLVSLLDKQAAAPTLILSQTAPALIVPDVFSDAFCDELITAFKNGKTFQGTVGGKNSRLSTAKKREDFIMPENLRKRIDAKFALSLFPEIEKAFGFEVTGRENYKIGLYKGGDEGGYFLAHRDNFDIDLAYRRVAMTLQLTDDYEGGGLCFPEYGSTIYRPTRGSAIAFPGSVQHEAKPVIKGDRYVLVGFFHGKEDEAFRQYYMGMEKKPVNAEAFEIARPDFSGIERSRDFFRNWQQRPAAALAAPLGAPVRPFSIGTARHQPVKIFESKGGVVFDHFLPDDVYEAVRNFALTTDYKRINTEGKISRAWHVHDGFPLRSMLNGFYYADKASIATPKPDYAYPTGTAFDRFIDCMLAFQPQVERYTGKAGGAEGWNKFSVTSWLYPPGTGLAAHDDGSGVYTGAYAFFLNQTWRSHWGGMLLLMDDVVNEQIEAHRRTVDQIEYHKQKWLHANNTEELMLQHGLARCIFPKGNRMVFIANNAYHMVTRVNEAAGDNLRMSLAGFFDRKK